jgi:proteasome lid subunit RPN8/RPN11
VHRARNSFASPIRYEIDPDDLYRIWKQIEAGGDEVIAFYHSHVKAPAWPSQTDINWADNWPGASHLICSLGGDDTVIKAFEIGGGAVQEVELDVDEG